MSILIKGMEMPLHATCNGEKDTIYQCAVVVHKDNTAELVVRRESAYPFANCNEAHIDKYQLIEVPTPHGRLIDENELLRHKYGFSQTARVIIKTTDAVIEAEVSDNA